ncbi:Protein of unknown function [Asanoa hainanensis]|uniref:DUF998 domain-containing protein n=1 Tax=Asanoa hainanensis TaxID=560556 RepID=A0A239MS23_9ACTN|nr:DUF998 domain-containing protein [Asanoa hainanensis]SNT45546.1 Protein of unknown function [Asanoa hainanensis]
MNKARAYGSVSIVGLLTAVVATVVGHIGLGPGYDPLKLTISDYALSNRGVTIEIAMVALAIGAPALLAGLRAVGVAIRGLPTFLLSIWSVGLLIAAIIPTDPPSVTTMSNAALIHRYASVAAFVALPIAAAVLAARFTGMGKRLTSTVRSLCVTCAVGVGLLWYVAFPGGRVMMGLVERSLVLAEIAILAVLSIGVFRASRVAKPATAAPLATGPVDAYAATRPDPATWPTMISSTTLARAATPQAFPATAQAVGVASAADAVSPLAGAGPRHR